jgi:hypothetical protein
LALIINKAGYGTGFLMVLSITDSRQIGNIATSKWNNGIIIALLELIRHDPYSKIFREFNQMVSGFFEDLVLGKQRAESCRTQIYDHIKGQEIDGTRLSRLITDSVDEDHAVREVPVTEVLPTEVLPLKDATTEEAATGDSMIDTTFTIEIPQAKLAPPKLVLTRIARNLTPPATAPLTPASPATASPTPASSTETR